MLHVGIDATSWANDRGFGRFTRELVTSLAARNGGFRYTLVFDRKMDSALPANVSVITANTKRSLTESAVGKTSRSFAYLLQMGKLVREAKFDVFFYPAVYSYFPLLARVPCVVCYHDTTADRFPELVFPTRLNRSLWRIKTRMAQLQTTRAMTISQASAKDLEQILGIPVRKIDVVTEAADPIFRVIGDQSIRAAIRGQYGIRTDAELLVHVGGLNRHKNLTNLLKAMIEIVSKRPRIQLALVGDTSGKGFWDNVTELKTFVKTHPPLDEHVRFTGYISDADMTKLLNSAEALVFPSLWEGFGLPAVEAMSCGLPVLASNRSSLPEIIGDAGLFFDPENPLAIADCVLQFFSDLALLSLLRQRAVARAALFTWDRAAELAEASFRRCYEDARQRTLTRH